MAICFCNTFSDKHFLDKNLWSARVNKVVARGNRMIQPAPPKTLKAWNYLPGFSNFFQHGFSFFPTADYQNTHPILPRQLK